MTGGSSQFGQRILLDQWGGFDRIILHRIGEQENVDALKKTLGSRLMIMEADFTSEVDTRRMMDELHEQGCIPTDIIHLPAGKFELIQFAKVPWAAFQRSFDIAVRSAVIVLQTFLPLMSKAHEGRVIVMLSAVTGGIPPKYLSYYVATKYALLGLVKALSAEYAEKGISINGISPEMADTNYLGSLPDMVRELNAKGSPRGRLLTPDDVLPAFRMLLSEDARAITGQNILITDGR